jgi:hypothetical protein
MCLQKPVRFTNLESEVAQLKAGSSDFQNTLDDANGNITSLREEVFNLKTQNTTLRKALQHQKEELAHVLQAMQAMQARLDSADRRLDEHTALTAGNLGESMSRIQAIEQKLSPSFQNQSFPLRSQSAPRMRQVAWLTDDAPAKEAAEDKAFAKKAAEDKAIAKKAAEDEAIAKKATEDKEIAKENGKNSEMAEAKDAEQQGLPFDEDTKKLEALKRLTGIANELIEEHLKKQTPQIVEGWAGRTRHSKEQFKEKIDLAIAHFLDHKSEVLDDLLAKNWESEILMQLLKQRVDESDKLVSATKENLFDIIEARITKEKAANGGKD